VDTKKAEEKSLGDEHNRGGHSSPKTFVTGGASMDGTIRFRPSRLTSKDKERNQDKVSLARGLRPGVNEMGHRKGA